MATTVASQYLTILAPQPDINSGWSIHVLDYKDMKSLVAVVSEFSEMSFTIELNGPGTGSITMDEDSTFWGQILNNGNSNRTLLNNEYVFEAWENNTPRFAWVAQTVENTLVGEDETRAITISGPGIAQVLTWACINRPAWPTKIPLEKHGVSSADGKPIMLPRYYSYQDTIPAALWRFPIGWPTMRMWYTVFKAAQRRGMIPFVTPMFGPLKDSGGQPWIHIATLDEKVLEEGYSPDTPSEDLLDFLGDCTGQDYSKWFGQRLEWVMHPGFKLDVRHQIGTDQSKNVRFFQGNIISDSRTRDREAIYNRVIVIDVDGNETTRQDAASVRAWNLREQRNETEKNVTSTALMSQIADRIIQQSNNEKDQWTVKIPYDDPGRQPFRNFNIGDWIGFNVDYYGATPTAVAGPQKERVMAITISVNADSTVAQCELTLKSLIDLQADDLQKQITRLINNPTAGDLAKLKKTQNVEKATDGQALVFNGKDNKWEPGTVAASGTGGGGAGNVWVQSTDPTSVSTNTVAAGDFWLETYD